MGPWAVGTGLTWLWSLLLLAGVAGLLAGLALTKMGAERGEGHRRGMTRRKALLLAGAGAVSAGVGAAGLLRGWGSPTSTVGGSTGAGRTGDRLAEPTVISSEGGRLRVALTATAGPVSIAGRRVQAMSYNGSVPGPTLRLKPGDRVTLDLVNRLGASTNLHTHGLHVSPEGNGDNPFLHIRDGETFRYEYEIPPDHPAGTFWYHPHLHGTVADQLFAGLMGAIVVQRDDAVPLPARRERVLLITDTSLDGDRIARANQRDRMLGREGELVLVNGQLTPTMTVSPGGYEHWHLINACTSRFLRLRLEGAELLQVAGDTGRLARPTPVDNLLLATGNRAELLVRVPGPGRHRLVAEPVDRGGMGMGPGRGNAGSDTPVTLLEVEAAGETVPTNALPGRLVEPEDLRAVAVNGRRTLTFAMGMGRGMGGGMSFMIDGREFDPDRVDTSVRLGTVEEWTIRNTSPMNHPFHLHVWPVQLVARDGGPVEGNSQWYDMVILFGFGLTIAIAMYALIAMMVLAPALLAMLDPDRMVASRLGSAGASGGSSGAGTQPPSRPSSMLPTSSGTRLATPPRVRAAAHWSRTRQASTIRPSAVR